MDMEVTTKEAAVYGLTVRAVYLVVAAEAWKQLGNPLSFFDLVIARRRNRTLKTRDTFGEGAVTRIPEEVWEEIKFRFVHEEFVDAEERLIKRLNPTPCSEASHDDSIRLSWSDNEVVPECNHCWNLCNDWNTDKVFRWDRETVAAMEELLGAFGLALVSQEPILVSLDPPDECPGAYEALALMAYPSQSRGRGSAHPQVGVKLYPADQPTDYTLGHTTVDISFDLPRDVNSRFIRLIRLFNMEVLESSVGKIVPLTGTARSTRKREDSATKAEPISGISDAPTTKIRPRWLLWMSADRWYP
ncbi:hypothetical protein JCM16303_003717 [Sporobolomyces ruberrimus]